MNELANQKNVTMESLRTKILPLLKGNQLLSDWFLQLFPTEKAPDSSYSNYETLYMKRKSIDMEDNSNKRNLSYERIPTVDIVPDPETSGCGLKYLQGRLFYGHRILLPARLSFLVLESLHSSEIDEHLMMEDDESIYNQPVDCVHNINEIDKNNSENEGNSPHSCDDEDDDDIINDCDEKSKSPIKEKSPTKEKKNKLNDAIVENNYVLCDDLQLRTHALRLNPTVHYYSDNEMMESVAREDLSDSSLKGSPKRQGVNLLPLFGSKQPAKKPTSPNAKKIKSPESNPTTIKPESLIKLNSPALAIAKKLKSMTEEESSGDDRPLSDRMKDYHTIRAKENLNTLLEIDNDSESDEENTIEIRKNRKRLKKRASGKKNAIDGKLNSYKKQKTPESQTKILTSSVPTTTASTTSSQAVAPLTSDAILSSSDKSSTSHEMVIYENWTRDEDKIILEAIECGYSSEEDLINKVEEKLNRRGHCEIGQRYQFLMNVLRQFQSNA